MENPSSGIHDWDWEVVPNSDEPHNSRTNPPSSPSSFGGEIIRSDYFSAESAPMVTEVVVGSDEGEEGGDGSDDPNWVDPTSVVCGYSGGKRKRSMSPTSSSSPSSDSSGRNLLYLIQPHSDCCGGFDGHDQGFSGFEQLGFSENFPNSSEIVHNSVVEHVSGELPDEKKKEEQHGVGGDRLFRSNSEAKENEDEDEDEKKRVVWWKVPLEVLKYCVWRVSPVWSLSMAAAALMGFVILRRRYLYKMKRKSLGIQLNVTVDDKKVSQFMSRAARLNEAFSVVKRIPIIGPALPAPGMVPWPVMSLR